MTKNNKTKELNKGDIFGSFVLDELIGKGGNGQVWRAINTKNERVAIKFLTREKRNARNRFEDEISIVTNNQDIVGLLPILEFYIPQKNTRDYPYYVMPLAEQLSPALKSKEPKAIIEYMIQLAQTLAELHKRGISHRDIKPKNLLFYNRRIYISDFGLADFPGKQDITERKEDIGPKWTMAPEMRRNAKFANGIKADSYSFAKTIWILLTKEEKGFDGQYSSNTVLGLKNYIKLSYYKGLDDLLADCTSNVPDQRPEMEKIIDQLTEWLKIESNDKTRNVLQWKDIQKEIFPLGTPIRAIWEQIDMIVTILNRLSITKDLNHMFLPTGGGMNLLKARRSHENQCIELDVGAILILKPKRLVFESFSFEEEWNYFRLETDKLPPSGYYEKTRIEETLTELSPLTYTDILCYEFNDYNGQNLPRSAREIIRVLSESSFVIFQDTSRYNRTGNTYDARHNQMTTDEFRNYIGEIVSDISKCKEKNLKRKNHLILLKPSKFKSKRRLLTTEEVVLLNKIILLAKKRENEEKKLKEKYNIGAEVDFSKTVYFTSPRPHKDLFKKYLESLSRQQIILIAAVMYGGRDMIPPQWGTPLDVNIAELAENDHLIEKILEKEPLVRYLRKGLKLYIS